MPWSVEWLAEGPRAQVKRERELTEAAGSPDHQGVVAWCEPYPYADAWELAATDRPLLCLLDQVTDPRNLGAVVRSAAGAGATGVVVPTHGATAVTPAVCRSSAGAVEHLPVAVVPNLARYLADVKSERLWAYAAAADGETACGRSTCATASRSSSAPRARACVRSCGAPATGPSRSRSRPGRVAERERRGGGHALRGPSPARSSISTGGRGLATSRSTCSTGRISSTRAAYADRDALVDDLASFVAVRGARGVVVFDGAGADRQVGRSTSASPTTPTRCSSVSPRSAGSEAVLLVTSDAAIRGTSGQEVRKRASAGFLAELGEVVHREGSASRLGDRVDDETRARLERLRRGRLRPGSERLANTCSYYIGTNAKGL